MKDQDKPAPTDRQREILAFIESRAQAGGSPPTVREIASHFRIRSPKGVSDHLAALERKGYLEREPGKARSLRLIDGGRGIPIVGTVAAGSPITAVENREGMVELESLFGSGELFAVKVRGDSMSGCGIHDGDLAVVRKSATVAPGTVAVAYVDGEATVKRILKTARGYRLQPANDAYAPLDVDKETPGFAIGGPVVGVIRSYRVNQ
jgi:repressor LexA